jgi:hypothetical protein
MFSELPKLLGRDFAVGFFLPVVLFLFVSDALFGAFGRSAEILVFTQQSPLVDAALVVLVAWIGAILLLSVNYETYRFLEGYGRYNPLGLLAGRERARYGKLQAAIQRNRATRKQLREQGQPIPKAVTDEQTRLYREAADRYPDSESFVLPTSFGNTIRAFEIYSRVMYGLDGIPGWTRLTAVIPADYLAQVDGAKAIVDFWVNVILLAGLFLLEYAALAVTGRALMAPWMPVLAVVVIFLAYQRAQRSAEGWGEVVKASFDVYLPKLLAAMQFRPPDDNAGERELWQKFSQAVLYRLPNQAPDREHRPTKQPDAGNGNLTDDT